MKTIKRDRVRVGIDDMDTKYMLHCFGFAPLSVAGRKIYARGLEVWVSNG